MVLGVCSIPIAAIVILRIKIYGWMFDRNGLRHVLDVEQNAFDS